MYLNGEHFTKLFGDTTRNREAIWLALHTLCVNVTNNFRKYGASDTDRDDMASAALLVCVRAIEKYNPDAGPAFNYFTSVATNAIRQAHRNTRTFGSLDVAVAAGNTALSRYTDFQIRNPDGAEEELELLNVRQVAEQIGISIPTVNAWRKRGLIPFLPGHSPYKYMYDQKAVERIVLRLGRAKRRHTFKLVAYQLDQEDTFTVEHTARRVGLKSDVLYRWIAKGVVFPSYRQPDRFTSAAITELKELVRQGRRRHHEPLTGIRMVKDNLMSASEAAAALDIHTDTFFLWVNEGIISRQSCGRYRRDDVERLGQLRSDRRAAEYVGISRESFRWQMQRGRVPVAAVFRSKRWYHVEDLDKLRSFLRRAA